MAVFEGRSLQCRRGGRDVFAGLDFALPPGGALLLTGPNGSGKSSLLRLVAGLLRPAAGQLLWDGRPIAEAPDAHAARLPYLGHPDAVKPGLSRTWEEQKSELTSVVSKPDDVLGCETKQK